MSTISWQIGSVTDIGGGSENQDDYFIWERPLLELCVICVFDGHGKEVGKVASKAARDCFERLCETTTEELLHNPCDWLINAHKESHVQVKQRFRLDLESRGFQVDETPEGYLIKRKSASDSWTCVHGGTSCTAIIISKHMIYCANVGDSTATLCTKGLHLQPSLLTHLRDSAVDADTSIKSNKPNLSSLPLSNWLAVSADHSPESPSEFHRLRSFRSREDNSAYPALGIVYDAQGTLKSKCRPVFEVDSNGNPSITNLGRYYKNVRQEWASLVHTPLTARFQDALAFTRSVGDLHLHTYGVTHLPEVQSLDLRTVFSTLSSMMIPVVCLAVCSDGVWDNWTYEDVSNFLMDASCIRSVTTSANGAAMVASAFMQRNDLFGKQNFGSHADNATGIVVYLSNNSAFPSMHPVGSPVSSPAAAASDSLDPLQIKDMLAVDKVEVQSALAALALTGDSITEAITAQAIPKSPRVETAAPPLAASSSSRGSASNLLAAAGASIIAGPHPAATSTGLTIASGPSSK